jgi:hypothetical protein
MHRVFFQTQSLPISEPPELNDGNTSGGSHMRKIFFAAAGLSAMLAMGATANAETASQATCTQAQQKVAAALASDTSANHDQAQKESRYGRDFCLNGLYGKGMDHYAQAMKLLGIS